MKPYSTISYTNELISSDRDQRHKNQITINAGGMHVCFAFVIGGT